MCCTSSLPGYWLLRSGALSFYCSKLRCCWFDCITQDRNPRLSGLLAYEELLIVSWLPSPHHHFCAHIQVEARCWHQTHGARLKGQGAAQCHLCWTALSISDHDDEMIIT